MLPKKERLSRKDFSHFFTVGRRVHTKWYTLVASPHKTLHVSVVVPKKVAQGAVVRNRVRRRIYDMVRRYKKENPLTGVYIFLTKQPILTEESAIIEKEIQKTLAHTTPT